MVFLTVFIYFIVGFGSSLFIYDYLCKDFNKKNKNRQFKLTWEEYSRKEGIGPWMTFAITLWPILAIICICYFVFQYPLECIRERNGIK